jgi:hypothetical protein
MRSWLRSAKGVGRLWWAKVTAAVWPSTVVVPNIFREHYTQVPLIEDQYAVGKFGPDRTHEPFGKTVRPRTTRRNPHHADAHIGEDSIERCCELTGPISDQEMELGDAIAKIHHQVADLLGSPSTVRVRGHAQQVHGSAGDLQDEEHGDPQECDCAVHMEEVTGQHRRCLRAQELPPGRVGDRA